MDTSETVTSSFFPHDLYKIHQELKSSVINTPLLSLGSLGKKLTGQVLVKVESLQKTGAFKYRGALYRLMKLNNIERKQGVIAYSSGNFACGLAAAGRALGISVRLVMPSDAPVIKIQNAENYSAQVILCHDSDPSREEAAARMATQIAEKYGLTLLHPFDDPLLIQGQGTVAIELLEQLQELSMPLDNLLCPVGGGSLVAGSSLVPDKKFHLYGVEPKGYDGMNQSLRNGKVCRALGHVKSHCDALQALSPGQNNFEIAQDNGVRGLVVNERSLKAAIELAFSELKLVLEPSGAVAIAALLEHPGLFYGKTSVAIATGGNVDRELFAKLIR